MNCTISVFTKTVSLPDGKTSAPASEARDWRLLAFLIWKAHEAESKGEGPPSFQRDFLLGPLGLGSPRELSNALVGTRRILKAAGCSDYLVEQNGTIAIGGEDALDCDLAQLLRVAREEGPEALVDLVPTLPFGLASPEHLLQQLRPRNRKRREQVGWIEEMVRAIDPGIDGQAVSVDAEVDVALSVDDGAEAYLRSHRDRCSHIDPRGMGRSSASQDIRLPLEDVYISLVVGPDTPFELIADLEVTSSEPGREGEPAMGYPHEGLLLFDREEGVHFTDLIRDSRWSVILGKPGMGKTTLLHWLTLHHARTLLEDGEEPALERRVLVDGVKLGVDEEVVDLGPARLPILVRVGEWASAGAEGCVPELIDYLGHHRVADEPLSLDPATVSDLIRRWLAAGKALVLLDGLDEVSDAKLRNELVRRVERFVRDFVPDPVFSGAFEPWSEGAGTPWWKIQASRPADHGGNQILVTSREHGYKEAALTGRFRLVQARPLDMPAIDRFCRRWTLAVEHYHSFHQDQAPDDQEAQEEELTRRAEADAERLIGAIESHSNIRRLVDNPLLLTVLAMLQRESDRLPTTRLQLYTEASRVLVERRSDWTLEEVIDLLGPFALWLHENRPQGYATLGEVRTHLRPGIERNIMAHEVDEQIDTFIDAAQQQVGLLVEVGTDRYGFMHGTFREYFAAMELARKPESFHRWFVDHMHSQRWVEVSLLGVAAIAQQHPEKIEDILEDVLEQPLDPEALLHHDLLFVASCLAESARSAPALTVQVIGRLLEAGAQAREAGFEDIRLRVAKALTALSRSRRRVALPALVEALEDPIVAPVATEIVADAPATTPALLQGLDRACQRPERSPLAALGRARVARELYEAGEEVAEHLLPLGMLFARYPAATAAVRDRNTPLAAQLAYLEDRVQPLLHGLLRWLLAPVEADLSLAEDDEALAKRAWEQIFEMLPLARGADCSALVALAMALDPENTPTALAEALAAGKADAGSLARYFTSHPEALPPVQPDRNWLNRLDAAAVIPFFRQHPPELRVYLQDQAWKWLTCEEAGPVQEAAERFLNREAARFGWLPLSVEALEAIRKLLIAEDPRTRRLGTTLLSCLRVIGDVPGAAELMRLLEGIADDPEDLRAAAAAAMLAELPQRPFSSKRYDLLAGALSEDNPLRPRILAVLNLIRPAATVDDAVLERAQIHAAAADDDPAVFHLHSSFAMNMEYGDPRRILAAVREERPWAGQGRAAGAAVQGVVDVLPELDSKQAALALEACSTKHRNHISLGIETAGLAQFALGCPDPAARGIAATLAVAEATLSGRFNEMETLLAGFASVDPDGAAVAMKMAAHCLPSSDNPARAEGAERLRKLSREVFSQDGGVSVEIAGALLAVDVLGAHSPSEALGAIGELLTTHEEIATAILFALATDHNFPSSALGAATTSIPAVGLVMRRLCEAAAAFCLGDREMTAMLDRGREALDSPSWLLRRAAMLAFDAVATASPGQFLKSARETGLREKTIEIGRDRESFSVRRLALGVLSQFRTLDQNALDLIAAACRDYSVVSVGLIERCRTFEGSDLDISRVLRLLHASNPKAIDAAAVLVAGLARTAPSTHGGSDQRRTAIRALASAAASSDPMLDCFPIAPERALRQSLHERLSELVWEGSSHRRSESVLGTAATAGSWDFSDLKQPSTSKRSRIRASTVLAQAIRDVAGRDTVYRPAFSMKVNDKPYDLKEHGLEDLRPAEAGIVMQAVYETLEMRVGIYLADRFDNKQLDEFEVLIEAKDEKGASAWLLTNSPDYKEVVAREAASLFAEIRSTAGEIQQLVRELRGDQDED